MRGLYAFVSDFARFKILYEYGGLYFDTDVEVIRQMDDIIRAGGFMGIESGKMINPGLGMGCKKHGALTGRIIQEYEQTDLPLTEGGVPVYTISTYVHRAMSDMGISITGEKIEKSAEYYIYPEDYFNPLDDLTGVLNKTKNTRSIHWFTKTWMKGQNPLRIKVARILHRYLGINVTQKIKSIFAQK